MKEKELTEQVEQLRVQLAGCLTAADGATNEPATQGMYGWSPAYQAVLDLRIKYDKLDREHEEASDRLSGILIHLDSWARGEADLEFIKKAAASILIHQQCPGWKCKPDPFGREKP